MIVPPSIRLFRDSSVALTRSAPLVLKTPSEGLSEGADSRAAATTVVFAGDPIRTVGDSAKAGRTVHWPRLLAARAHAQEADRLYPNQSGRRYGALVVLDNGIQSLGTNIEASRQCTLCDLRLGVASAFNQHIQASARGERKSKPGPKSDGQDMTQPARVADIYVVNAQADGEPPVPCADCQEWLNTELCTPQTRLISLEPDPEGGVGEQVRVRTVGEVLPLHAGRPEPVRFWTEASLPRLWEQAQWSDSARQAASEAQAQPHLERDLARMLQRARRAYQRNEAAGDSHLRTGVNVMVSPGRFKLNGGRFDWTTRWFESADLKTAALAVQIVQWIQHRVQDWMPRWTPQAIRQRLQPWLMPPRVTAVAYYGDDPNLPPIPSLGRIARRRGSAKTLVVTVENDRVHVRTIGDFMPEMYQTRTRARRHA